MKALNVSRVTAPIIPADQRAYIIASLSCVDYVFIFPETNIERYLREIKPDIWFKGGDYNINSLNKEEEEVIRSCRIDVRFESFVEGISSTNIIKKIK